MFSCSSTFSCFFLASRTCKCTYIKHDWVSKLPQCVRPHLPVAHLPHPDHQTMGSASSKLVRTSAAKSKKKPSLSGARMPQQGTNTWPEVRAQQPWASEFKDEGMHCMLLLFQRLLLLSAKQQQLEIQRDAKDPQLLANLSRLKPVDVHHHKLPTRTVRCLSSTYYRLA